MNSCSKCGCNPCACGATTLASPQIIGGIFDAPTINGPTINGGQANNLFVVGATVDCTTRGCTQPQGICNESLATTSFVCTAIEVAISSSNPAFCEAVTECILNNPSSVFCPIVQTCINTIPGIINTTNAFGVGSRATTTTFGVVAIADRGAIDNLECGLAIDPCALAELFCAPNTVSPFWLCFSAAVNSALSFSSPGFCAAVFSCGAAPLASPLFTGNPRAPTAPTGTATSQIATTAFVQNQIAATVPGLINAAISSGNAAFCAAVAGCIGSGSGGLTFAVVGEVVVFFDVSNGSNGIVASTNNCGCTIVNNAGFVTVTFSSAQANTNYYAVGGNVQAINKTVNGCDLVCGLAVSPVAAADTFTITSAAQSVAFVRCS
jgi:hypothetical protein